MLFLGISTFPGTKINAAASKMMEILVNDPPPDYIKRTYYVTFGGKGIKMYALYDIEEGKEAEGFKAVAKRNAEMIQSVEGMEVTFEAAMSIEDAFAAINTKTL